MFEEMAKNLDNTFSALADPTRRQVVELLREGPKRAGDLATSFGITAPSMSRHLRILRTSGLVEADGEDADARVRVYRLCEDPFDQLKTWIEDVKGFWAGELSAFQEQAIARKSTKGRRS
jgi:DNA-binding transcriptional ArsR family regulator